jgi:hypothetical protein
MRQQGAGLLIAALLVVTIAAFAAIVAASQSGGDIQGSNAQSHSVEALLLAESGLERAIKRFATGTACASLGETITDLSTIGLTGRTITVSNGLATDFSGAPLPAFTQCRVPVSARIDATNVARTLQVIIDKSLLGGADNLDFNNPAVPGAPSGWTLNPASAYTINGGPDGAAPACSRSAWVVKTQTNDYEVRAQGDRPTSYTVARPSTTTIYFNWRLNDRGPASTPEAGCGSSGGSSGPSVNCSLGSAKGAICFNLIDSGGGTWVPPSALNVTNSSAQSRACSAGSDAGAASTFSPCQGGYQTGYPTKSSIAIDITGSGAALTFTTFRLFMFMKLVGRREMFLDDLEVVNGTAIGAARVKEWRDCAVSSCPPT